MDSRIATVHDGDSFAETVALTFQGQEFTAGGAMVTPTHALAYMSSDMATVQRSDGTPIGKARIVARWRLPWHCMEHTMFQVEATIGGRTYTGRTCGGAMIWRGKVKRGS